MTIKFLGNDVPIVRIETGFWSFDNACSNLAGERGLAVPAYVELYADEGKGKTAFATSMAGIIAKAMSKDIAFLDWEIQDFQTILHILEQQEWSGTLYKVLEETDEASMDKFYELMEKENYGVGIVDSIGAFMSIPEEKGKQSDAIMGKSAMNMSRFSRTVIRNMQLRKSPAAVFCTNHMHPKIGFMQSGMDTAGGVKKKYLTTYRIWLKPFYWKEKSKTANLPFIAGEPPIGWVLEGRFDKNRTGYAFTKFHVVMIMGEGLHKDLSAMFDCLIYGHATINRNVISIGDQSIGHINKLIEKRDQPELFKPFHNRLKAVSTVSRVYDESYEDEGEENEDD